MYRNLLIPLDGTPLANLLTEHGLALARACAAQVQFLHVQPDVAQTDEGAILHSVAPGTFHELAAGNAHAILARAAAAARAAGVVHDTHVMTGARPAQAILDTAQRLGCDLLVVASHGRTGWGSLMRPSVTRQLMEGSTVPLHLVAVESRLRLDPAASAVAIIKAEHRSLDAVLHGMQRLCDEARAAGREPDHALLGAMLFYVAEFPERLHHPKEDAHLFVRLQAHTREFDGLIRHLQDQHEQGAAQFQRLRRLLEDMQMHRAGASERFHEALGDYQRSQWAHMADEERLILPAAQRFLSIADWQAIEHAFSENGDPRFGGEQDEAFAQLFDRVLRLAALSAPA